MLAKCLLESTKEIEINLAPYILCKREEVQKTRTITLSYILLELSLLIYFHKRWVFFVMSCCTSGVGFQVLPFIDNSHLGSIPGLQLFSLYC